MLFNKRIIIKILAAVTMLVGASMLLPTIVSLYYHEFVSVRAFLICGIPMIVIGLATIKLINTKERDMRLRDGFLIVALAWLSMSVLGALPFMISGSIPNFFDAFFETASGFTTTGASILTDIEALPQGMLFWRSFTHWLGGMGILVLTLALLPMLGIGGQKVMRAETTGPTMDKSGFTIQDTAQMLYKIYMVMTVIEIVLLMLGGLNLFDAAVQTFGTMGTGGFSNYANSIAHFNSLYVELVIGVFMILAGINFGLYARAIMGKPKDAIKDPELKVYIIIVAASVIFIGAVLAITKTTGIGEGFRQAFFQVASIITTTGYATTDFNLWPLCCKMVLFFLMISGACASSTGGGIKIIRIILAYKIIRRGIRKRLHPNAIEPIKIGSKTMQEDTVSLTSTFLFLYLAITLVGFFIISFESIDFETCITSVVACISNIGPGFGLVGPTGNFAFYSWFSKLILSLLMIAGRLELYAIILPLFPRFWNSGK